MKGALEQMAPAPRFQETAAAADDALGGAGDDDETSGGTTAGGTLADGGALHFCALKGASDGRLLMGANQNMTEIGP